MNRMAIFGSGSGTNAENILEYFKDNKNIQVLVVLSNKDEAEIIKKAHRFGVTTISFTKDEFYNSDKILKQLLALKINLIVLAGFLWLIPKSLIAAFPKRIINIHPALLPKYGGKGMYGHKIHEEVINNKEIESGITIHYIDELYDKGEIIFQARCKIEESDTAYSVENKIKQLEHKYYPQVIENILTK